MPEPLTAYQTALTNPQAYALTTSLIVQIFAVGWLIIKIETTILHFSTIAL